MRRLAVLSLWVVTVDAGFGRQPDRKQPALLAEEIKVPVNVGIFTFGQITWLPCEGWNTPLDDEPETEDGKAAAEARDWLHKNGGKGIPHADDAETRTGVMEIEPRIKQPVERFAETGAGNVKRSQGIDPPEFRYRVRFHQDHDTMPVPRVPNRREAYR